jgi:cell division protein ZapE
VPQHLVDRAPVVVPQALVGSLIPPPRFADVRFGSYAPDPHEPTQAAALAAMSAFAAELAPSRGRFLGRPATGRPGVYLDGGYGVGKTHLLASLWHVAPEPRAYCTFVELTHLVGALGFAATVDALSGHRLVAIDEFELDDPGDTVLVSTLLQRLVACGVKLAATSNTLPGALGRGRFSERDFRREIQGLATHFATVHLDGEDYRYRGLPIAPAPLSDDELARLAERTPGASYDDFDALLRHLAQLHPSRYGALLDGVELVCIGGVRPLEDQAAALRFVVLADRLYDRDLPVATSGVPLDVMFPGDLLGGGYRKKYGRAISRLAALARQRQPPLS